MNVDVYALAAGLCADADGTLAAVGMNWFAAAAVDMSWFAVVDDMSWLGGVGMSWYGSQGVVLRTFVAGHEGAGAEMDHILRQANIEAVDRTGYEERLGADRKRKWQRRWRARS